jgi:hypothetical protein
MTTRPNETTRPQEEQYRRDGKDIATMNHESHGYKLLEHLATMRDTTIDIIKVIDMIEKLDHYRTYNLNDHNNMDGWRVKEAKIALNRSLSMMAHLGA